MTKIGKLIRKLRRESGLSQEELAFQIGARQSAVSHWENGAHEPNTQNLLAMAKPLGVEPMRLIDAIAKKRI